MPLHPTIQAMFAKIAELGRPALSAGSPDDARALVRATRVALGQGPQLHEVREISIPTRSGAIDARLYLPEKAVSGLVVYFHGGGWVVGELDDYDAMARTLAARSGCAVVMPDYRLAPEHPFPAGIEDAEDALRFAARNFGDLAGGDAPLIVGGDSAGGNLATVIARSLRDEVALAAQVLVYPVTDHDFGRASYLTLSEGMQLTRKDMEWFFDHYAPRSVRDDPRISPMVAPDLAGLPPAVIVTAEYDVLRDEGEAYAQALSKAGVPVTFRRIDGLPHGFLRMHNLVDIADEALGFIASEIAAACRTARR
jgi:acetyl esterase